MKINLKLIFVCVVLLAIAGFSFSSFYGQLLKYTETVVEFNHNKLLDLKGFDGEDGSNNLQKLVGNINQKYTEVAKEEKSLKSYNLILSFFVVILTGLATLFTSIQNFKNQPVLTNKITIWVLVLTFISTIGNSSSLYLNKEIENTGNRLKRITELRENLFVEYNSYKENKNDLKILEIKYESYISNL